MSINVNDKNLGHATAYAYYKAGGGTMTEAEFTEFMADFGTASQTAVEAAQEALASKNAAQTAATTATNKATEATTAATTATNKAAEAQADADAAALDASQALSAASTATTKATEATTAAATATSAKTDAVAANTAAQSAKTAAQTAQTGAETAAASVSASAAQIATNAEDISQLKNTLQLATDAEVINIVNKNQYLSITNNVLDVANPNASSTGYGYTIVQCDAGDAFTVSGISSVNNPRAWVFTDSSYNVLAMAASMEDVNDAIITAPQNAAYICIHDKTPYRVSFKHGDVPILKSDVETLKTITDQISKPQTDDVDLTLTIGKYISASGEVKTASTTYGVSNAVDVSNYRTVFISGSANYGNLIYAFYDAGGTFINGEFGNTSGTSKVITEEEVSVPLTAKTLIIAFTQTEHAGLIAITGYEPNIAKRWSTKKWVCVGDSLTEENSKTTKHYFDYVAEESGISTVNMGVSGSGYARLSESNNAFYQRISNVPTDADVITIFGSFNDIGSGLNIGTASDTGTTTIAGCINTTLDNLFSVYPLAVVGLVTPTPWEGLNPLTQPNTASAYADMIVEICSRRGVPCLDLFHTSLLRPWSSAFRQLAYSKDGGSGTHPDENGHKLIAPRFKAFLESLLI